MIADRVLITVNRCPLGDGSPVYNVSITGLLHACSESDAAELAHKIRDAIDAHTVDSPIVAYN